MYSKLFVLALSVLLSWVHEWQSPNLDVASIHLSDFSQSRSGTFVNMKMLWRYLPCIICLTFFFESTYGLALVDDKAGFLDW